MNSVTFALIVLMLMCSAWLLYAERLHVKHSVGNSSRLLDKKGLSAPRLGSRQYSGEICSSDSDCAEPRKCYTESLELCDGTTLCRCFSIENLMCDTSSDCLPMDRCYQGEGNMRVCVSCQFTEDSDEVDPVDEGNCPNDDDEDNGEDGDDDDSEDDGGGGQDGSSYTLELCRRDSDCAPPRTCIVTENLKNCTDSDFECHCISLANVICSSSSDCLENDKCYGSDDLDQNYCLSCNVDVDEDELQAVDEGNCESSSSTQGTPQPPQSESPRATLSATASPKPSRSHAAQESTSAAAAPSQAGSPASPVGSNTPPAGSPIAKVGICISADLLEHLEPSELVFGTHRRASVLCDRFGNCATPGHMLIFRGTPQSMHDYCARYGGTCVRRVKLVNSPKMKLGLRIASRSLDVQFTAFAAAKESWVETTMLRIILRMGA